MINKTFKIASTESAIEWIGRKITGSHNGTVAIKQGELILRDGKLTAGRIVVDTTSIAILDVMDPTYKTQFAAHLASDDFFSTQKFPESVLEIVAVNGNRVDANLTIKGIKQPIHFDAEINVKGDLLTATAKLLVDRTKYDMKFRSGNFFTNLGDTLIYDDFELSVSVTAKQAKVSSTILI